MKISILLPYKENFTKLYAGAVSIFVNDVTKISKFKKNIKIYGNTLYKDYLSKNYVNIPLEKIYFRVLLNLMSEILLVQLKIKTRYN